MPHRDAEFIKRLRATFRIEAEEHLQAMSSGLLELEKLPAADAGAVIERVFREAHSLKGAARAVDMQAVESICQAIETVFSAWKRKEAAPSPAALDVVHKALDLVRRAVESPDDKGVASQAQVATIVTQLGRLPTAAPPTAPTPSPPPPAEPPPHEAAIPAADTVRLAIDKLDAHLRQVEDLMAVRLATAQRKVELSKLSSLFDQWRQEWQKVSGDVRALRESPTRSSAVVAEFLERNHELVRTLEVRLADLTAQAEHDRYDVARRVGDLLEASKKLLMLPFSTLSQAFPKLVRDLSRQQGKEVELVIRGNDVNVDKRILDEMKDAMIHILRNSIDHGIERPSDRQRLGKPQRATITVNVTQVNGDKVEIAVSDDGAGIDVPALKRSAVRHKVLSEEEAAAMDDRDAMSLVFHSDVSTSPSVTALSGRGLGMPIVRAKAEKLGGRVSIESRRNEGTTLRIVLPLTLAAFRGILVEAGGQTLVVPIMNVDRVVRVRPQDVKTVENRETITVHGAALSLVRMAAILDLQNPSPADPDATLTVLVLSLAEQRIGFVVDQVLGEEEVLVKPLRPPLVRVRNVAGVTVLGTGKAVLVLNVADLMKAARSHGHPATQAAPGKAEAARQARRILVVEDSITSRMLLKGILESAGYDVKVAVDGIDAFAALREHPFDLVVSDVEMPRMNGFDLTARIRADRNLGHLPVVLVTALESREHRERGLDAGANAYVVKSRFDQGDLLQVIRRLI